MWWMLLGCPYVGTLDYAELQDNDDDGVLDERFDGRDCDATNPSVGDCDADADGVRRPPFGDDCDDDNPAILPGAAEICNGLDDDCDGQIDDAASIAPDGLTTFWLDVDGDSYGSEPVLACTLPIGAAAVAGDCDDNDPTVNPGADELCDPVDQDCDGDPTTGAVDRVAWLADSDGDGYGSGLVVATTCTPPSGSGPAGDCDDNDPTVNPGTPEICNGLDDDCDADIDDADGDVVIDRVWTLDLDEDGYGAPGTELGSCTDPTVDLPYVLNAQLDCDDSDPNVQLDRTWWFDEDQDGFGTADGPTSTACVQPFSYAPRAADCDDLDSAVNPEAQEICNELDDNCNGSVDEGSIGQAWFEDLDGDGFGADGTSVFSCLEPEVGSWTPQPGDCDDTDEAVNPFSIERCGNDEDDDCDGLVDADDPSSTTERYYLDGDGDGYGREDVSAVACGVPPGFSLVAGDCNDSNAALWRGLSFFPDPSASLQTIVDETCVDGTVLITEDVTLSAVSLSQRAVKIQGIGDPLPTVAFDLSLENDPNLPQGAYLFQVPTGGQLTLSNLSFQGSLDGVLDARGLASVAGGAELDLSDVTIHEAEFRTTMVAQGAFTDVRLERVQHTDLLAGSRGLFWVQSRSTLSVEDTSFANIQTRLTQPDDDPVVVYATAPEAITFRAVTVHDSATTPGTNLFRIDDRSTSDSAAPSLFQDLTVTDSGPLFDLLDHDVDVARGRWSNVGAAPIQAVPAPAPGDPWTCKTDAASGDERDVMKLAGTSSANIQNTEFIASGSVCLEAATASVRLEQSAFALPDNGIVRGQSTPDCADTASALAVRFVDNVILQEAPALELFRATGTEPVSLTALSNVSATHVDQVPSIAACVPALTVAEHTVEELQLVRPRTSSFNSAEQDTWVLHSYLDTCGSEPTSPVTTAQQGVSFGPLSDPRWQRDLDNDQVADGWERFWFGDTASCSEAVAYWDGLVPSTFTPPNCQNTPVDCPGP